MNLDGDRDRVKEFLAAAGRAFDFDVIPTDQRPLLAGAGGTRLPLVYVVDDKGVIIGKYLGENAIDAALGR